MSELIMGSAVPSFTGVTTEGGQINEITYSGKWLVLYFYPRDNTPGCTTEAQDFQRLLSEFEQVGAAIVGVSNDNASTHARFCAKQGLTFPLIADTEQTVSRAFDVIREKKMYGKTFEGIERSTFLISPDGHIHTVWRKVKVPGHAEAVLATIREAR